MFTSQGKAQNYTLGSIVTAIWNVKANRDEYKTKEAYEAQLAHFERGRSLFRPGQKER